jgi:hypothetical protein
MNYTKMTNAELIVALKQSQIDVKNQGTARADMEEKYKAEIRTRDCYVAELCEEVAKCKAVITATNSNYVDLEKVLIKRTKTIELRNESNRVFNANNLKLERIVKELTDKCTRWENVIKSRDESISVANDQLNKAESELTAADQQSAEYKSMAEHCGAGEIRELKKELSEVASISHDYRNENEHLEFQLKAADKDYGDKIKCLKDELAKWQNQNTNNGVLWSEQYIVSTDVDYSYMDKFGEQQRGTVELTGNDPVVIPTDASKEIKRLESELETNKNLVSLQCDSLTYWQGKVGELKLQATVADYDALKADYDNLSRLFIEQSIKDNE